MHGSRHFRSNSCARGFAESDSSSCAAERQRGSASLGRTAAGANWRLVRQATCETATAPEDLEPPYTVRLLKCVSPRGLGFGCVVVGEVDARGEGVRVPHGLI